jgi:hypothetical protein
MAFTAPRATGDTHDVCDFASWDGLTHWGRSAAGGRIWGSVDQQEVNAAMKKQLHRITVCTCAMVVLASPMALAHGEPPTDAALDDEQTRAPSDQQDPLGHRRGRGYLGVATGFGPQFELLRSGGAAGLEPPPA